MVKLGGYAKLKCFLKGTAEAMSHFGCYVSSKEKTPGRLSVFRLQAFSLIFLTQFNIRSFFVGVKALIVIITG